MPKTPSDPWDVVIIGGGACGLMAALGASRRGLTALVLEKNAQAGIKILASGGGHCNYTNRQVEARHYHGESGHFMKTALRAWTPRHTLALFEGFGVTPAERDHGRLFVATGKAADIRDGLVRLARQAGAEIRTGIEITGVERRDALWRAQSAGEAFHGRELVLACGGKAYPQLGATGFGLDLAVKLGLRVTETAPALVPFAAPPALLAACSALSGLAVHARVRIGRMAFHENVLFTHTGLSGPAILQASSYWRPGETLSIDWHPVEMQDGMNAAEALLRRARSEEPRKKVSNILQKILPGRLLELLRAALASLPSESATSIPSPPQVLDLTAAELGNAPLRLLAGLVHAFPFAPAGDLGYRKAEVMRGGVDTAELSSKTLECRKHPGLFLGGELVDVTGQLGGYNLQWAWASGHLIGESLGRRAKGGNA